MGTRRVPLRLMDSGRVVVGRDRWPSEDTYEGVPEAWADVDVEAADQWDATCWRSLSGGDDFRPEMLPVKRDPRDGGAW